MKIYKNIFERIISPENLFAAWLTFKQDKQKKEDVLRFERDLERNIFQLHRDLKSRQYRHGEYFSFYIRDPKVRHIHKATVRDRVLHHAIFAVLNPIFEPTFIANSFSCRIGKGNHKGVEALGKMVRSESHNFTKPCFVLKCDIRKFFETIDHEKLLIILFERIKDKDAVWLLREIIGSFSSSYSTLFEKKGLPIGNLTSQLFANVYLNGFDQFVKQKLRVKHYARYTDDFMIVGTNTASLKSFVDPIRAYLADTMALRLHPKKVSIRKIRRGIDFLGYTLFSHYRLVRTKTRKRIFRKLRHRMSQYKNGAIGKETLEQSLQSYLGVLSHADAYELGEVLKNEYWFLLKS